MEITEWLANTGGPMCIVAYLGVALQKELSAIRQELGHLGGLLHAAKTKETNT
jgi:hypothetical protein